MSHQIGECAHVWSDWRPEERRLGTDIVVYVLVRNCVVCGHLEEH